MDEIPDPRRRFTPLLPGSSSSETGEGGKIVEKQPWEKPRPLGRGVTGFISPTSGDLDFPEVVRYISAFIEEDPERRYKLIIGTDSEAHIENAVAFVSVIVVHRVGRAARYFWTRSRLPKTPSLRQRIYHEATLSLALAQELTTGVGESLNGYLTNGRCELEIHVDIGHFGPTRDMIREIVGMISGNGFRVKIKPESYAASTVADKHI